jgi:hypothetical protein
VAQYWGDSLCKACFTCHAGMPSCPSAKNPTHRHYCTSTSCTIAATDCMPFLWHLLVVIFCRLVRLPTAPAPAPAAASIMLSSPPPPSFSGGALSRTTGNAPSGPRTDLVRVPPPTLGSDMAGLLASGAGADFTFVVQGQVRSPAGDSYVVGGEGATAVVVAVTGSDACLFCVRCMNDTGAMH